MRQLSRNSRYAGARTVIVGGRESFTVPLDRPVINARTERLYVVTKQDELRPDMIAHKAVRDPAMWWAICQYNGVLDPLTLREGDNLKIPEFATGTETKWGAPPARDDRISDLIFAAPPKLAPTDSTVTGAGVAGTETDGVTGATAETLFLYNFPFPGCLTGRVHFEIQVSVDPDYSEIIVGRSSAIAPERWTYYDQSGGYKAWPPSGVPGSDSGGTQAIFRLAPTDPVIRGGTYYIRVRPWVDDGVLKLGKWVSEAIVIP